MIKFFREIRQSLLTENKNTKYLKYALGEIASVVIGILSILKIDTWSKEIEINNNIYINKVIEELYLNKERFTFLVYLLKENALQPFQQ
jgi:hypothetical protein